MLMKVVAKNEICRRIIPPYSSQRSCQQFCKIRLWKSLRIGAIRGPVEVSASTTYWYPRCAQLKYKYLHITLNDIRHSALYFDWHNRFGKYDFYDVVILEMQTSSGISYLFSFHQCRLQFALNFSQSMTEMKEYRLALSHFRLAF